jgi:hypothetical protein
MSNTITVSDVHVQQPARHRRRPCQRPVLTYLQGEIYEKIIQEVINASQNDFEENGVQQQTLMELQQVGHFFSFSLHITCLCAFISNHLPCIDSRIFVVFGVFIYSSFLLDWLLPAKLKAQATSERAAEAGLKAQRPAYPVLYCLV